MIPDQRLDIGKLFVNRMALAATTTVIESGGCAPELVNSWRQVKKKADLVLAERHYTEGRVLEAARMGLPKAQGEMAYRHYHGTDGVAKDLDQCFFWAKKAAEGGDELGQFRLGYAMTNGQGTVKDNAAALKLYEFVAASPANSYYTLACNNIGIIYEDGGFGVTVDYAKAASWYLKGAEGGSRMAPCNLGLLYKNGRGVPKDLAAARSWLQKSADQKQPKAMFELGVMTVKGEGGAVDYAIGMRLLVESSKLGNKAAKSALERMAKALALTLR